MTMGNRHLTPRRGSRRAFALSSLLLILTSMAADAQLVSPPATAAPAETTGTAAAVFGGGCFWCMEPPYDKLPGVISTTSGYSGGRIVNPSYAQVSAGGSGHLEVVQVKYDPRKVSYETLLEVFWRNIDPFAVDRQFCDAGRQYRSAIFVANPEERRLAEASKLTLQGRFEQPIATEILSAVPFYPAEDYHQDYYKKNPVRYKFYRFNCGRDQRLQDIWGERR